MKPAVRQLLMGRSVNNANGALTRWFNGGVAGKKLLRWGDSTVSNAVVLTSQMAGHQLYGDGLQGVTLVTAGENGASLDAVLTNSALTWYVNNVIAQAPDLIVLCFGINDVRQGACDRATLATRLRTAISTLRAGLPNVEIVLWTPNSLLCTNASGLSYISPLTSAQSYTDTMWRAYNDVKGSWPYVVSIDKMVNSMFGRTSLASSTLMQDELHPANAGQFLSANQLIDLVGYQVPFDPVASAAAWTANPSAPWSTYAYAPEDTTKMRLVEYGRWNAQGSTFLDFSSTAGNYTNRATGNATSYNHDPVIGTIDRTTDYIQYGRGGSVFKIPATATVTQLAQTTVRISHATLMTTQPVMSPNPGWVYIWRPV